MAQKFALKQMEIGAETKQPISCNVILFTTVNGRVKIDKYKLNLLSNFIGIT